MNFTINQTFTLTTDDSQQLTYTIKDIDENGRLLVHSSLLERAYFVSQEAFEDFLKVIATMNLQEIALQLTKAKSSIAKTLDIMDEGNKIPEQFCKEYNKLCEIEIELRKVMISIREKTKESINE